MLQKDDNTDIIELGLPALKQECFNRETHFINLTNNKMNFIKYILHSVVGTVILGGVSLLIHLNPSWFGITVGSLIVNLYTFLVATQGSASVSYTKSV
jgi:hypothetical protein